MILALVHLVCFQYLGECLWIVDNLLFLRRLWFQQRDKQLLSCASFFGPKKHICSICIVDGEMANAMATVIFTDRVSLINIRLRVFWSCSVGSNWLSCKRGWGSMGSCSTMRVSVWEPRLAAELFKQQKPQPFPGFLSRMRVAGPFDRQGTCLWDPHVHYICSCTCPHRVVPCLGYYLCKFMPIYLK